MNRPLALIGAPGAGKTTIGRMVADMLGRTFVDLDETVTNEAGKTVSAIFGEDGENSFRDREARALRDALRDRMPVIACGGGIVLRSENVDLLRSKALTVYLEVPVDVAVDRLSGSEGRPLIEGLPRDRIAHLIESRIPLYQEAAAVTVDARREVDVVAQEVSVLAT